MEATLLKTIVENLVDNKEAVSVEKVIEDGKGVYQVKVDEKDMGKVIGKNGKMAFAIRKVVKEAGTSSQRNMKIKFVS